MAPDVDALDPYGVNIHLEGRDVVTPTGVNPKIVNVLVGGGRPFDSNDCAPWARGTPLQVIDHSGHFGAAPLMLFIVT